METCKHFSQHSGKVCENYDYTVVVVIFDDSIIEVPQLEYRSRALLGTCTYNSTGRKYAPISEMRLITNDISSNRKCVSIRIIAFSTP